MKRKIKVVCGKIIFENNADFFYRSVFIHLIC